MHPHLLREEPRGSLETTDRAPTHRDLVGAAPEAAPADDCRRVDYLPTPREIADACAAIRAGWTNSEKRRRFVGGLASGEPASPWRAAGD